MSTRLTSLLIGLAAFGLAGLAGNAAHIDDLSREPVHNALGDRPGTLWVEAAYENMGPVYRYHFTSFPIGKQVDIDGNTIKTFLYLPAHGYAFSSGGSGFPDAAITAIGDGTNYLSGRGRILQNLHEEYRSSIFDPMHPRANAGDITVWSTTTAVPDSWIPQLASLGTVASQFGDTAFSAGFGRLSTPSTGLLPETGDSYGWYARTLDAVPGDTQPGIFADLIYHAGDPLVAYNGRGQQGDSGSWVFNSSGQLIGTAVAVTGNDNSLDAATVFANFTASEFYNQLAPYVGIQVVPVQVAKISSVTPDGVDLLITFRAHGGTNCFVQAAATLGGTNAFVDVSPPFASSASGVSTNTFRHVGVLTNQSASFYRIRL